MLTSQRRSLWQGTKKIPPPPPQAERWSKKSCCKRREWAPICLHEAPHAVRKAPTVWSDGSISATPRPTNTNEVSLESSLQFFPFAVSGRKSLHTLFLYISIHTILSNFPLGHSLLGSLKQTQFYFLIHDILLLWHTSRLCTPGMES